MKHPFRKSPLAVAVATLFAVLACEPARAANLMVDGGQQTVSGQTFESATEGTVKITNGGRLEANDLSIHNTGSWATHYGIFVDKNSQLDGDGLRVTSTGAASIRISSGASAKLRNSEIGNGIMVLDSSSNLDLSDSKVFGGVVVSSQGVASLDKVIIENSATNGAGVSVANGSQMSVRNSSLSVSGTNGVGINAQTASAAGQNSKVIADNVQIEVDGLNDGTRGGTHGVFARAGGMVEISNSQITTRSAASNGFTATGSTAYSSTPSTITAKNVSVETTGQSSHGLAVASGAQISLQDSQVEAKGTNAHALLATGKGSSGQDNQVSLANSDLYASQASVIRADAAQLALQVTGSNMKSNTGMLLDAMNNSTVTLNSDGPTHLIGDIRADGTSRVDLSMNGDGLLSGSVSHGGAFSLSGQSAWQVTGDSDVSALDLHDGRVAFAPGTAFKTLTVDGDLSGNGQFFMNTDLAAEQGDLLKVNGQALGQHELIVADSGHEPSASGQQLMLVDTAGGDGRFSLYGEHVDAGAFRYTLEQQGDDWYLRNTAAVPVTPIAPVEPLEPQEPVAPGTPDLPLNPVTPSTPLAPKPQHLSTGANAALANVAATQTLWSAEMNALAKRLGELRMGDDDGGVWVRGIHKRYEFGEHSSRAFDQDVSGMEVGADTAIQLNGGKLFIGGMLGMAQSDTDFGEGASGKTDSKLVGTYATYLHDSGFYVDGVLKYNRFDNEIKSTSNLGERVTSNYDADGIGMDVEVGKQFKLQDGWFVEPQLELTATRTSSDAYTASNGLRVEPGDVDSLQSRVGTLLGRNLKLSSGQQLQPYAKVSYVTEHGSDSEVTVNDHRLDNALPGDRTELGAGVIVQLSAKQKVYLDIEHASGDDLEEPWAVNLGYRHLW
ncbi:autotransporter outer membrane beta-barrel domain-containing protein [Pseudomonas sp. UL073]|uniref:Autotransporter outer membrane beta-barrel domain-containing protein n=1 Tax=Zestomonas insulae TaxID=2809017 RepID=A0ABS2IBD4_9GAMM|nr:autotransporter outer membrane beta-barrel domain-containing protein [Pseudomonas insulae]MBM7060272.1 autotransporter outer membrane beta-barrel domain-containing protein [Pseudomonas insulae]